MTDRIWHIHQWTIPAALSLLPGKMDSPEARAQMLAIGLHESKFDARMQGGRGPKIRGKGPAAGFWQFEKWGGVNEILVSDDTRRIIQPILTLLCYPYDAAACHEAIADNDVLAACFTRLLLWRDPWAMPLAVQAAKGYQIYLRRWRPNPSKTRPEEWPGDFRSAWDIVNA